jgi:hypothetical protein
VRDMRSTEESGVLVDGSTYDGQTGHKHFA